MGLPRVRSSTGPSAQRAARNVNNVGGTSGYGASARARTTTCSALISAGVFAPSALAQDRSGVNVRRTTVVTAWSANLGSSARRRWGPRMNSCAAWQCAGTSAHARAPRPSYRWLTSRGLAYPRTARSPSPNSAVIVDVGASSQARWTWPLSSRSGPRRGSFQGTPATRGAHTLHAVAYPGQRRLSRLSRRRMTL